MASDVPAASPALQDSALKEVDSGQCVSLATLAAMCEITRDEARALHGEKVEK